jgi:curved DNA-binding protein
MDYKDYYDILGVPRHASEQEIRRAYRLLARKHHPDRNPGDKKSEERFKEINEAHAVLTDSSKRQKYDRLGAGWQQWQKMGRNPGDFDFGQWSAGGGPGRTRVEYGDLSDLFGEAGGFSDFFQSIFGMAGGPSGNRKQQTRPRSLRGQDYEQPVRITLEEAYHGTSRLLEMDERRLEVTIPPGVKTGSKVRLAGKGFPSAGGGPPGDIFLVIEVLPHRAFERKGDDLHAEVPVELYTALLGGEVRVRTMEGPVQLKIPPETQSGRSFRLRGQGMPTLRAPDRHGDLYARVRVLLPQELSEREKELFQELAGLRGDGGSASRREGVGKGS